MKQTIKKILVPVGSAAIGGLLAIGAVKASPALQATLGGSRPPAHSQPFRQFDSFFNDDFFGQNDPFEEMKKMRDSGDQDFEKHNPFDPWFSEKFGGGSIEDISRREDGQYVYYDIKVQDLNSTSINTQTENGYVTITGTVEKKSADGEADGGARNVFKSSFTRTFPLPDGVDQDKMQMVPEDDKIVLKFPKSKA